MLFILLCEGRQSKPKIVIGASGPDRLILFGQDDCVFGVSFSAFTCYPVQKWKKENLAIWQISGQRQREYDL